MQQIHILPPQWPEAHTAQAMSSSYTIRSSAVRCPSQCLYLTSEMSQHTPYAVHQRISAQGITCVRCPAGRAAPLLCAGRPSSAAPLPAPLPPAAPAAAAAGSWQALAAAGALSGTPGRLGMCHCPLSTCAHTSSLNSLSIVRLDKADPHIPSKAGAFHAPQMDNPMLLKWTRRAAACLGARQPARTT